VALKRLSFLAVASVAFTVACADVVVDDTVVEAVSEGRARVIVALNLPGGFRPEGSLTEDEVHAQRAAIVESQEAIIDELAETDARVIRRMTSLPFLALEIGPESLDALLAMPERVARITADEALAPNTRIEP